VQVSVYNTQRAAINFASQPDRLGLFAGHLIVRLGAAGHLGHQARDGTRG